MREHRLHTRAEAVGVPSHKIGSGGVRVVEGVEEVRGGVGEQVAEVFCYGIHLLSVGPNNREAIIVDCPYESFLGNEKPVFADRRIVAADYPGPIP